MHARTCVMASITAGKSAMHKPVDFKKRMAALNDRDSTLISQVTKAKLLHLYPGHDEFIVGLPEGSALLADVEWISQYFRHPLDLRSKIALRNMMINLVERHPVVAIPLQAFLLDVLKQCKADE